MKNSLEKLFSYLSQNTIHILSTSADNIVHSRPIGSMILARDRIYYCMNKNKAMYTQLCINNQICICVCLENYTWVRIYAKVCFDDDLSVKQIFIDKNKTRFQNAKDDNFTIFYLSDIKAEIHKGLEIEVLELK
ncbi:pyridoxamine 5'-phosphate oxidase family protein [Campylobacter jejuni]|nr:pyridoxamine 5'-phosphate oxidase family protein [Campylobacter jejuni]